jgi:endonuclease YncB( thermonuclease family)
MTSANRHLSCLHRSFKVTPLIIKTIAAAVLLAWTSTTGLAQQASQQGVIRDVTPRGMTPAPQITAPLKRVPGVAPPAPEVRARNLYRIAVIDTATFEGRYLNRVWRLEVPGITGVARDDTCKTDAGEWPCGGFIIRSLQRHIRLTALNCEFAWQPSDQPLNASCKLRGTELAELLVSKGWAYAAQDAPDALKDMAEQARKLSVGIYQPPPSGWQDYQALTRQGDSSELPPPPDLPILDITGPLRESDAALEENLPGDQRPGEGLIDQP